MAELSNRMAGMAYLHVDGKNYLLSGDLSYNVSSVSRESLLGMDGVHGYKETPHAGFISATLRDAGGLTVADFNAMTNVTVTVELANGKTVVGRNMWTVETQATTQIGVAISLIALVAKVPRAVIEHLCQRDLKTISDFLGRFSEDAPETSAMPLPN